MATLFTNLQAAKVGMKRSLLHSSHAMANFLQGFKVALKRQPAAGGTNTQSEAMRAFDATRQLWGKPFKALCYAPFMQLSFSPDGNVSACCVSRTAVLGNVRWDRLDTIWQGERMQQFRAELQNYSFPSGCESCEWSLNGGNFLDHMIRQFDVYPIADGPLWPLRLEFAMSNTCNLACIMCSGDYSSAIRAREGLPPLPKAYGDQFFEDLAKYLPHVQTMQFLGGEPFLQEECFRIWDMLTERGLSPRCQITTNGSIYNARVERVLQNLPVDLSVSVDGANKETVERIRVNNTYETLMDNIHRFGAYAHGTSDRYPHKRRRRLHLNYCVMSHNWRELPDFFRFAQSIDADVWTKLVTSPSHSSLFELPLEEQQAIVTQLGGQTAELQRRLSSKNRTVWLETIKELQTHATQDPSAVHQIDAAPSQKSPMHRAWALMKQGKSQEALEAALQTLPTDPLYYRALVLVGEIRTTSGDYEGAEQALESAVQLAPRHPEGYLRQAWLRYHQGRFAEGISAVARAEDGIRAVRSPETWLNEELLLVGASLCYRSNNPDQAREKVERLLELRPDRTDARRLHEEIHAKIAR